MRYDVDDLHIGYPWSREEYDHIWRFMEKIKVGDEVVFLGDTYEIN